MRRRHLLAWGALAGWGPGMAGASPRAIALAASWQLPDGRWQVGILRRHGNALRVAEQVEVPTRAHGLVALPGGELLAVARRPGDWLLRWSPRSGKAVLTWAEPDRAFTGHAVHDAARARIYTAESALDSGQGLIGVRDARSMEKLAEWHTQGRDPHQFLLDGQGGLLVANGGIETRPESGRRKLNLASMDSCLVRLGTEDGAVRGRWQLEDRRLGMRHLAWGRDAGRPVLGIAMQAEHDTAAERERAPVLALFDGQELRTAPAAAGLAGYAGDICWGGEAFALSAPRSHVVARFDAAGRSLGTRPLAQACPLAWQGEVLLAGGAEGVALSGADVMPVMGAGRLDNHWIDFGAA